MTTADWRALVYRELQADNWYAQPVIEQAPTEAVQEVVDTESRPLPMSANNNGAHPQQVAE